ncbi:MAG: hypothetical protein U0223_08260 [Nitrospira sp.]
MRDLFMDSPLSQRQRPSLAPQNIDLIGVAFRFEMAALDRRLRAERVLNAVQSSHLDELSEQELDQLLNAIARAYHDRERAEFMETVADDFRLKAFQERTERHAA